MAAPVWAQAPSVPGPFRPLHHELEKHLSRLESQTQKPPGKPASTVFAVELSMASGHRGEALLSEKSRSNAVTALDRVKELGVTGVSISIPYPLLASKYDRCNEYRGFYETLIGEARKKGLKTRVELTSFPIDPELGGIPHDYSGETLQTVEGGLGEMTRFLLRCSPDFLSLPSEPDTFGRNTGLRVQDESWARMIRSILAQLPRTQTRVGAGAGTWAPIPYFEQLVRIPEVQYLDLHVFPIQQNFVMPKMLLLSELAKKQGKGLVVGQAWLYKAGERELGRSHSWVPGILARDAYSFWEPLDARFVGLLAGLARQYSVEFCSFYWTRNFYTTLEYDQVSGLPAGQILQGFDAKASPHLLRGNPNELGRALGRTIREKTP